MSDPIDPRVFSVAAPTRPKVLLYVRQDDDHVEVRMSLPLDPASQVECDALLLAQDGRLDVRYLVTMDLCAERAAIACRLAAMYDGPSGDRLRSPEPLAQPELRQLLAPLALQGWSILDRLLFSPEPRGLGHYANLARAAVRAALTRPLIIDIVSEHPLFPWALLYDGRNLDPNDRSTLNPECFWGFRHEVQERAAGTSPLWRLPEFPSIVTSVCSDADAKGFHKGADHPLIRYPHTSVSPTAPELGRTLAEFNGDCLYFFGHAGTDADPPVPASSWIALRGVQLTVAALQSQYRAPRFLHDLVVVFLNGCRTSPLATWNEGSLLGYLCTHGGERVCCLATVAEVPDEFGARFAGHFWEAFVFDRQPIGRSLLAARRRMLLEPPHSPLGLVYTLLGRVDTCIPGVAHA